MSSDYLTIHELCERWSVSERTLQYWRRDAYGPAYVKIGNRILYSVTTIESYERVHEHLSTCELSHQQFPHVAGGCH